MFKVIPHTKSALFTDLKTVGSSTQSTSKHQDRLTPRPAQLKSKVPESSSSTSAGQDADVNQSKSLGDAHLPGTQKRDVSDGSLLVHEHGTNGADVEMKDASSRENQVPEQEDLAGKEVKESAIKDVSDVLVPSKGKNHDLRLVFVKVPRASERRHTA